MQLLLAFLAGVVLAALLGAVYGRRATAAARRALVEAQATVTVAHRTCKELLTERDAAIAREDAAQRALRVQARGHGATVKRLTRALERLAEQGRLAIDRALPPPPAAPALSTSADRLPTEVEEAIRARAGTDGAAAEHLRAEARKILRDHPGADGAERATKAVLEGDDLDSF